MKVNFAEEKNTEFISNLFVGSTFTCPRKTNPKENGIYMKIAAGSDTFRHIDNGQTLAVNLATGHVRIFDSRFAVIPVDAEVNVDF